MPKNPIITVAAAMLPPDQVNGSGLAVEVAVAVFAVVDDVGEVLVVVPVAEAEDELSVEEGTEDAEVALSVALLETAELSLVVVALVCGDDCVRRGSSTIEASTSALGLISLFSMTDPGQVDNVLPPFEDSMTQLSNDEPG